MTAAERARRILIVPVAAVELALVILVGSARVVAAFARGLVRHG